MLSGARGRGSGRALSMGPATPGPTTAGLLDVAQGMFLPVTTSNMSRLALFRHGSSTCIASNASKIRMDSRTCLVIVRLLSVHGAYHDLLRFSFFPLPAPLERQCSDYRSVGHQTDFFLHYSK